MNDWFESNQCLVNDKLTDQAVWFIQNMLLVKKTEMEQIAEAIKKIHKHAGELAKA